MKVKLKDICSPKQWKTISTKDLLTSGFPVFGANGIIGYYKEYNHENETICVTCRGATCGSLNISEKKSYINGNAMALDDLKKDVNINFLYYYLKNRGFKDVISGSAQPQIIKSDIENIEVELLPIEEQNEFVKKVKIIENNLRDYQSQLQNLDLLIKSRFVEMFGDINDLNDKNSVKLGSICKTVGGGTPSTKIEGYYDGSIPWITTVALGDVYIDKDKAKDMITEKALKESATHLIPKNSIMVGTRVGVGKCSINKCEMCTNQDINSLININEKEYNKVFLKFVIDEYSDYFNSIKKGATILGITTQDLKGINVPKVSIDKQNQYKSFVEKVDKSKFVVQKALDKTKMLMDSLMQEYFG